MSKALYNAGGLQVMTRPLSKAQVKFLRAIETAPGVARWRKGRLVGDFDGHNTRTGYSLFDAGLISIFDCWRGDQLDREYVIVPAGREALVRLEEQS